MACLSFTSAGITSLCGAAAMLFVSAPSLHAQERERASSAPAADSSALKSTQSFPIFYDHALAAQGFPNPLVRARIAGHEAIFIVDSGAAAHILADWYVEAAGIASTKTELKVAGSGGNAAAQRLAHRLQGHWSDGQRFTLNDAMVIAFPPYFKSLRLGGLVSPQLLAPAGTAAVLDLRAPSLRFVPFARALSDLRRSSGPAVRPEATQPCVNRRTKLVNRVYLAPVTSAGVTDLVMVDTGATGTIFSEESKIAHAIESGSEPGTPSEGVGGVTGNRFVRNVQLLRGGRVVTVSPSVGKVSGTCGSKGALGMDALRSCLLILGENRMAFSCR